MDVAITAEVNRLRLLGELTQEQLGARTGRGYDHVQRMIGAGRPRQSWTIGELADYGRALGVDIGSILVAVGVSTPQVSLLERIIGDPDLTPTDKTTLANMVQVMLTAARR